MKKSGRIKKDRRMKMIRLAVKEDIDSIMNIIKDTIIEMNSYGNTQWASDYPGKEHFLQDINHKDLYVYEQNEKIYGMICINKIEPDSYKDVKWQSVQKAFVIHRMAVDINQRKKGIGMALMEFADKYAKEQGIYYLKTDTYSINEKMINLFQKNGFQFQGVMKFLGREKDFYCYDKILENK